MKRLIFDIETFSNVDLAKSGVYRYCEASDFEVLLFAYSIDGGEVRVVDLANGEKIPTEIINALTDNSVEKWAFNAQFERVCLSRHLRDHGGFNNSGYNVPHDTVGDYLNPASWYCVMAWGAYLGLPMSLEGAGAVLKLEQQKLTTGDELIRFFCKPCRPTAANGKRTRNLPKHAEDKWETFRDYCCRDVETELAICNRLEKYPMPETLWQEYHLDQKINDRGFRLDMTLVRNAIAMDEQSKAQLNSLIQELTEIDNPKSVQQMKAWLADNGLETDTLGKSAVAELLKTAPEPLRQVLTSRQQLAKSSVSKYQAMQNVVCADGRARGMLQFYGASRTGRWAGRLIQVQNLPQNHLLDLEDARAFVRVGDFDALEIFYPSVSDVLSQLIRTAFVPRPGYKFIVADFSAIEARVIAWLSGETWRNEVFASHGKIYEASASQMFNVPIEEITKGSPLRQKGKIAELALGYGGSIGALKNMGALDMGLSESELQPLVNAWRNANPNITGFWNCVDRISKKAVEERAMYATHGITFSCEKGMLLITLPSRRRLAYVKPRIAINEKGFECLMYNGVTDSKKWATIETYGAKLVENIVQAVSRDILTYAMQALKHYFIVCHVHDEVVIETDDNVSLDDVCRQMSQVPPWADGLVLGADGFECSFYRKD